MDKISIKILNDCRVDGRSLKKGENCIVSQAGAKLAVSSGRAIYDSGKEKDLKKSRPVKDPARPPVL